MDYNELSDVLLYEYKLDLTSNDIYILLDLINNYSLNVHKAINIYKSFLNKY